MALQWGPLCGEEEEAEADQVNIIYMWYCNKQYIYIVLQQSNMFNSCQAVGVHVLVYQGLFSFICI